MVIDEQSLFRYILSFSKVDLFNARPAFRRRWDAKFSSQPLRRTRLVQGPYIRAEMFFTWQDVPLVFSAVTYSAFLRCVLSALRHFLLQHTFFWSSRSADCHCRTRQNARASWDVALDWHVLYLSMRSRPLLLGSPSDANALQTLKGWRGVCRWILLLVDAVCVLLIISHLIYSYSFSLRWCPSRLTLTLICSHGHLPWRSPSFRSGWKFSGICRDGSCLLDATFDHWHIYRSDYWVPITYWCDIRNDASVPTTGRLLVA